MHGPDFIRSMAFRGAFGNGKDNAREIVVHSDKFSLSSTPSGGAVFSGPGEHSISRGVWSCRLAGSL